MIKSICLIIFMWQIDRNAPSPTPLPSPPLDVFVAVLPIYLRERMQWPGEGPPGAAGTLPAPSFEKPMETTKTMR